MMWQGYVVVLLSLIVPGDSHSRKVYRAETVVQLSTHSGSFIVSLMQNAPRDDKNAIRVDFGPIRERDETANPIQAHCMDFTKSKLGGAHYTFTDDEDGKQLYGVSTVFTSFTYHIANVNTDPVGMVGVVKEDKSLDILGATVPVKDGDVIFEFMIPKWEFCGCYEGQNERVGKYVEFVVKINGAQSIPKTPMGDSTANCRHYDMGQGGRVLIPTKFQSNGDNVTFPPGYPFVESRGDVTFRFPAAKIGKVSFVLIIKPSTAMQRPTVQTPDVPTCPQPSNIQAPVKQVVDINMHTMSGMKTSSAVKATYMWNLLVITMFATWKWLA